MAVTSAICAALHRGHAGFQQCSDPTSAPSRGRPFRLVCTPLTSNAATRALVANACRVVTLARCAGNAAPTIVASTWANRRSAGQPFRRKRRRRRRVKGNPLP